MRKTKKQGREEAEQKAVEFLARTRMRARSNRNCIFFAVTSVTRREKFGRKGGENKVGSATKRKEENRVFQGSDTGILRLYIDRPLKSVQRNRITTCFQAIYK